MAALRALRPFLLILGLCTVLALDEDSISRICSMTYTDVDPNTTLSCFEPCKNDVPCTVRDHSKFSEWFLWHIQWLKDFELETVGYCQSYADECQSNRDCLGSRVCTAVPSNNQGRVVQKCSCDTNLNSNDGNPTCDRLQECFREDEAHAPACRPIRCRLGGNAKDGSNPHCPPKYRCASSWDNSTECSPVQCDLDDNLDDGNPTCAPDMECIRGFLGTKCVMMPCKLTDNTPTSNLRCKGRETCVSSYLGWTQCLVQPCIMAANTPTGNPSCDAGLECKAGKWQPDHLECGPMLCNSANKSCADRFICQFGRCIPPLGQCQRVLEDARLKSYT